MTLLFNIPDRPLLVFVVSLVAMWVSAQIGRSVLGKRFALYEQLRGDYTVILTSALTLLGLIVGFSFSLATSRYDQRKNYEEAEANAIGTEYLRADFLPADDGKKVRALIRQYVDQRILFYETSDDQSLGQIDTRTAQLQQEMWSALLPAAASQPTPITSLAVAGMNDLINSQGYTQGAWWYRIPPAAWELMVLIAVGCNLMIGYGAHVVPTSSRMLIVLPLLISVAFLLIADIDSPRHGLIRVHPHNLISVAESVKSS